MDRISALRNIEDALAGFEDDEQTLPELEREVRGILRTYATNFDEELSLYRATGESAVAGVVVVARSRTDAREQLEAHLEADAHFQVERLE